MCVCVCVWSRRRVLTGPLLLYVAGGVVAVGVQRLGPLLAGRVAGLVGMPGLLAVVAELGAASLSATHQPGTAGAARSDDGKPERTRRTKREGRFNEVRTEEGRKGFEAMIENPVM